MQGRATPKGTTESCARLQSKPGGMAACRQLGRTQLVISGLGFGCYRVDDRNGGHKTALKEALLSGINLIDTSTNYGDGHSELLVGNVLNELAKTTELGRDQFVVVSKVGYVQGQNLTILAEAEKQGRPYRDVVKYADGCWHSIHPDFIAMQLEMSLRRLDLTTIDVYLLHNPEYFFSDALKNGSKQDLAELRLHFYDRIRRAFIALERQVEEGRIAWYGVSSNSFNRPATDFEFTSLGRMIEIAEAVAMERYGDPKAHHFAVAQLPLNLIESEAALVANHGDKTVLEVAQDSGIAVLINRPLNAIHNQRLIRLIDYPMAGAEYHFQDELKRLSELEESYRLKIASLLPIGHQLKDVKLFPWGEELGKVDFLTITLDDWQYVENQMVRNQTMQLFQLVESGLPEELREDWSNWRNGYWPQLLQSLAVGRSEIMRQQGQQSARIKGEVAKGLPKTWQDQALSHIALGLLLNTPGVTCVLNGMRQKRYVEDSKAAFDLPAFTEAKSVYEDSQRRLKFD